MKTSCIHHWKLEPTTNGKKYFNSTCKWCGQHKRHEAYNEELPSPGLFERICIKINGVLRWFRIIGGDDYKGLGPPRESQGNGGYKYKNMRGAYE